MKDRYAGERRKTMAKKFLEENDIEYTEYNRGEQLRVGKYDYFPSTGNYGLFTKNNASHFAATPEEFINATRPELLKKNRPAIQRITYIMIFIISFILGALTF